MRRPLPARAPAVHIAAALVVGVALVAPAHAQVQRSTRMAVLPEAVNLSVIAPSFVPETCPAGPATCVAFAADQAEAMRTRYRRALERDAWRLAREQDDALIFERALSGTDCAQRLTMTSAALDDHGALLFELAAQFVCADQRLLP